LAQYGAASSDRGGAAIDTTIAYNVSFNNVSSLPSTGWLTFASDVHDLRVTITPS
jgi:hypothetical protein